MLFSQKKVPECFFFLYQNLQYSGSEIFSRSFLCEIACKNVESFLKKLKRPYIFSLKRHEVIRSIFGFLRKFRRRNSYLHLYLNFSRQKISFYLTRWRSMVKNVLNEQLQWHCFFEIKLKKIYWETSYVHFILAFADEVLLRSCTSSTQSIRLFTHWIKSCGWKTFER